MLKIIAIVLNILSILYFLCIMVYSITVLSRKIIRGPFLRFIRAIVEPYFNLLHKIRFMRFGSLDFAPLVSIITLFAIYLMTVQLIANGRIQILAVVGAVIALIFNIMSYTALFICVLIVIRFVYMMLGRVNDYVLAADRLVQPLLYKVLSLVVPRRYAMGYRVQLIVCGGALLILALVLRFVSAWFLNF